METRDSQDKTSVETELRPRLEKNHVARQSRDKTRVSRLRWWCGQTYKHAADCNTLHPTRGEVL